MWPSGNSVRGVTLVELVLVLVISGILFVATPPLMFHGVQTMVFLPRALAVNEAGTEAMQQIVEGGFSTLPGQSAPVRGLRFASGAVPTGAAAAQPALWLAEPDRIGFRTSDGQYVLIRFDAEAIKRSLPVGASCSPAIGTEEVLPYQASGVVRILPTTSLFRYYNQSGAELVPGCPPPSTIRRVDVQFVAQTGSGSFEEGQASQPMMTSVAVRVP